MKTQIELIISKTLRCLARTLLLLGMTLPLAHAATIDNGNGTVTDPATGLTWMRCSMGQTWTGNTCSDTAQLYNWSNARAITLTFAGQSDWRVPSVRELQTLVDRSQASPSLDRVAFPATPLADFWSATSLVSSSSSYAWTVNFEVGSALASARFKNVGQAVRLVRGTQASALLSLARLNADYVDNGDGTVTHAATQLMWKRCAEGQTWTGAICNGTPGLYGWVAASALTGAFAGGNDWRLPAAEELLSLVDFTRSDPTAINAAMFPNTPAEYRYWSATTFAAYKAYGWTVNFEYGETGGSDKGNTYRARLVRSVSNTTPTSVVRGWNLLGNGANTALNVATTFGDSTQVTSVWKWIAPKAAWAFYSPAMTDGGAAYAASNGYDPLSSIGGGEGFWVNAKTTFSASLLAGTAINSASFKNLGGGWTLIATADSATPGEFNNAIGLTLPVAGAIPNNLTSLWAWDAAQAKWYFYSPNLDASGGLASFAQNAGYLDFAAANKKLGSGTGFWVNKAVVPTGPVTGGTFSVGGFVVTIADNSIPPSVNAAPVATPLTAVPADIKVSGYETNVTSGAKAYQLTLGNAGFATSVVGSVQLRVPFDRSLVPDKTKIDSLHLLVRIFNPNDKTVVTLTGQLVGDTVLVDLTGFPASATAMAVFNPNMDVAVSDSPVASASLVHRAATLSATTWPSRNWAVVYDAVDVSSSVQTYLGAAAPPTPAQIKSVVKDQIASHAADAAAIYQGAGFRSPTLYVAKSAAEVGGAEYGVTPRYVIHFQKQQSNNFTSNDANELIQADGNHYGRVYIEDATINRKMEVVGSTVYAAIAHELLHAVQSGYGLCGKELLRGVREGTSTAYGVLLDRRHNGDPAAIPLVRQWTGKPAAIAGETFKLDNYLLVERRDGSAYTNQDFFVYLARKIGNNDFKFLATLFEQLRLTTEDDARKLATPANVANALASPELLTVLKGFDLFLNGNYNTTLASEYKDFVKQRLMEHSPASQFGRPAETTSGLAADLLVNYAGAFGLKEVQFDTTTGVTTTINDLRQFDPLSTRAIRIRPVAGKAKADITISVAPAKGTIGTSITGWVYRKASASATWTSTVIQASNAIAGFGADSLDEVVVVLLNPTFDIGEFLVSSTIMAAPTSTPLTGTWHSNDCSDWTFSSGSGLYRRCGWAAGNEEAFTYTTQGDTIYLSGSFFSGGAYCPSYKVTILSESTMNWQNTTSCSNLIIKFTKQ